MALFSVWQCVSCGTSRVYGNGMQKNSRTRAILLCQNPKCDGAAIANTKLVNGEILISTWHEYVETVTKWQGRPCPLESRKYHGF